MLPYCPAVRIGLHISSTGHCYVICCQGFFVGKEASTVGLIHFTRKSIIPPELFSEARSTIAETLRLSTRVNPRRSRLPQQVPPLIFNARFFSNILSIRESTQKVTFQIARYCMHEAVCGLQCPDISSRKHRKRMFTLLISIGFPVQSSSLRIIFRIAKL